MIPVWVNILRIEQNKYLYCEIFYVCITENDKSKKEKETAATKEEKKMADSGLEKKLAEASKLEEVKTVDQGLLVVFSALGAR